MTVVTRKPRSRYVGALATIGALAAVTIGGIAQAGPATTQPNGNFLVIDMEVSPPRAGSGTTLHYHAFFGNRRGELLPREAGNRLRLARGFRLRGQAFPKCPLPRNSAEWGEDRCARRARVGEGTFEADARPLLAEPVTGTFEVFNGTLREGNPTLVLLAKAEVGGSTLNAELNYEYVGSLLRTLPPPQGVEEAPITVTKTSLTVGATHRGIAYMRTPRRCRGSWRFGEVVFFQDSEAISANDSVSCLPRSR